MEDEILQDVIWEECSGSFSLENSNHRGRELVEQHGIYGGAEQLWLKFDKCR